MTHFNDLQVSLALKKLEANVYVSINELYVPAGARGVFGGTIAAMALSAATHTTEEKWVPHSLQSYFIDKGISGVAIIFKVEILTDGASFCKRSVRAYQDSRLIYIASISFTCKFDSSQEQPRHYQVLPPKFQIPDIEHCFDPLEAFDSGEIDAGILKLGTHQMSSLKKRLTTGPFSYRFPQNYWAGGYNSDKSDPENNNYSVDYYVRLSKVIEEKQNEEQIDINSRFNYIATAYLTDNFFLNSVVNFNGLRYSDIKFSVSLDHIIHFHRPINTNRWMLYHIQNPVSGDSRHLITGMLYDSNNTLCATATQEGLSIMLPHSVRKRESKL